MYIKVKKIVCIVSIAMLLSCHIAVAIETINLPIELSSTVMEEIKFTIDHKNYTIGDSVKNLEIAPYIKEQKPMIPLKIVLEIMEIHKDSIEWNRQTNNIRIFKEKNIVQMSIGRNMLLINEQKIDMGTSVEIKDEYVMVPISFIEKVFDRKVNYNSITNTITFSTQRQKNTETLVKWDYAYEDLLNKALKSSRDLKSLEMDVERTEIIRDDAKDDSKFIPLSQGVGPAELPSNTAYLKFSKMDFDNQMAAKKVCMIKDKIAYDVKNAYYTVLKSEDSKKIAKLAVVLSKEKKNLIDLNHKEGLVSDIEKRQTERDYEESKKQYDLATKELEKAYEKLNDLVGLDSKSRYILKDIIQFEEDIEEDIDSHISKVIKESPDIWALKKVIDLKDLGVKLHVFNLPLDYKWSFNMEPYDAKEIDVKMGELKLGSVKQAYDQSMRELYTSLKQLQDQYEKDKIILEKAKDDLKLAKINVEIGNELPIVIKKAELQLENTKKQLREKIMDYNKWIMIYNKPWIQSVKNGK